MRTLGTMIVPARVNELRRVLHDISIEDMSQLDPAIAVGMERLLGRELLAARLPLAESVFVCLYNLEPAGLIVLHRTAIAAQIRALAVSPDMRRKGLARTMLIEAEDRALDRKLDWLWMRMSSANSAATLCARSFGFRRYNPQFLRRTHGPLIQSNGIHVRREPLRGSRAERTIAHWLGAEATGGDLWVQPLIERELTPVLIPHEGQSWRLMVDDNEIGCAHLAGTHEQPAVTLWLDPSIWNKPTELACLRAVLNTLIERTPHIEVRLGSAGHLRISLDTYKKIGFQTMLDDRVLFVKRLVTPDV
jgi:GNAT superfamily N-acetyltransferase